MFLMGIERKGIMGSTQETKAEVKNGIKRMVFAVLSILLEVVIILFLIFYAGQKAGWIYVFFRFVAVILVLAIFGSSKTSSIRMTWMFVILLLPVFGTALYFLIGLNGHTLKMRKRYVDIDKVLFPMLPDDRETFGRVEKKDGHLAGIVNYIRRNASYPVYENTDVQYFDDAVKGIEAQKRDMAKAEKYIFMEYHAIEDAESWHAIRDVLAERVKAGVEVRVFYDDMGSIGFINKDFVKRTEEYGIQCRVFNPFGPGLNVFLDGKVGYTGGYNLANEYFHITEPYGYWKDTGIRLEGDAVQSLTVAFLEMWNAANPNDKDDKDFKKYMVASAANQVIKEQNLTGNERLQKDEEEYFGMIKETIGKEEKYLAGTKAFKGQNLGFVHEVHVGEDVYISMAVAAKKYAWFITPYLIITDEMCHAFALAARRGVDVRIITPGIPDKKIVYSVTRSYYNGLARHGVRIFEYTPGFCHAKMSIADDLMATCGTINMDYRSLYHHFENGCLYADCGAVMDTKRDFEAMFKQCKEVTDFYAYGRGAFMRIGQMLLRLAAPLM